MLKVTETVTDAMMEPLEGLEEITCGPSHTMTSTLDDFEGQIERSQSFYVKYHENGGKYEVGPNRAF